MTVWKASLRNFFAHKFRMLLSAIAIVLSVGFVCGTLVFTDTVNATFDKLFDSTAADLTIQPKADNGSQQEGARAATMPDSLVSSIASLPGVKKVYGHAEAQAVTVVDPRNDKSISSTSGAPTIADNWQDSPRPSLTVTSGHVPRGPQEAMLDADTAKRTHMGLGDPVKIMTAFGSFDAKLSGIATFRSTNPGATLLFLDTPTAQRELLGKAGLFTQVEVYGDGSRSNDSLKASVLSKLGPRYKLQTRAEATADSKNSVGSFLKVIKYAMLAFAGIGLLVGIFLIVNTFSMLVAQRTREIGLMRALGSSRRQVNRSVMIEALLLGIVGSAVGIAVGAGLALAMMGLMNSFGMHLDTSEFSFQAHTPLAGAAVGIIITLVSAYLPSRRAGKISPMAALRETGAANETARSITVRSIVGGVITLAGVACLVGAAKATNGSTGGGSLAFGVVLTLVGFVVTGPLLAAAVIRVLGSVLLRPFGPMGRLAQRNALRNPRRTGATAAALMIGLALVAGLSVVGSSMVASANVEIDKSVGADFIVNSNVGAFTPQIVSAVKNTKGLDHVTEYRVLPVELTLPDGKKLGSTFDATDPTYVSDLRVPTTSGTVENAYQQGGFTVDGNVADKYHLKVGDRIPVTFRQGGKHATLPLSAITSKDSTLNNGAMLVGISTVARYVPADVMPGDVMLLAAASDHAAVNHVYSALKSALHPYPQVTVRNQADYKKQLSSQISSLLNLIYGLLALAIVVAILGVVNTLALSVVERTREIGLSRAIGMSRRQMRGMIRKESIVIALFGAVIGVVLGLAWGVSGQKVLATQGLNTLSIPWSTIVVVFVGAAIVGRLAAVLPAFRASRMNILNAIATD